MSARLHALVLFVVVSSFLSAGPSIGRAAFTPAALVSITPNRGQQGQTITVAITARDTQFVPGVTEAKFGDGISVGGGDEGDFGPLTVTSPTRATAQITIADDADLDGHNVVVRTRQERIPLKDAFTVTPAPVRMTVTPDRGRQGETLTVTITGQNTHFQNGVTEANFGDDISTGGEDAGGFGPVVVSSPTRATVQIHIESDAGASERKIVVRTRQERFTLMDGFTVLPAPSRFTLSQNSGRQGETLTITIDGTNTQFRQGTTEVRFGAGISVGDGRPGAYGPVTVNSPRRATARIVIGNDADTDIRTVRIRTGDEKLSIKDAFNVLPAAAPITVVPNSGARGQTLTVTITSPDAHFVQGETEARFGSGIEVGDEAGFGPVTVLSGTQATAQLSIRSHAKLGARKVVVRTGKERFLLKDGFNVVASPITITLAPATGQQGQKLTVQITGTNSHFAQGVSTARFGDGISVGTADAGDFGPITVTNATTASAELTIAPDALLAARTVTVRTNAEQVSLVDGFTVVSSPAAITSLVPSSGPQGQIISITITGQNTHFVQGTTQVGLGLGIILTNVSVSSATSLTALASIAASADLGTRTLTVTTGSEALSLNNAFTVTAGTPVLQTVNPNTGQQGQQNLNVNLTGQFTHFIQGTRTASYGAGITVATLTVNSATAASAVLNIDPNAATGTRNVTLTTGAEVVTLNNGFAVTSGTPVLQTVDPNTGQQGQQNLSVNLAGQFTHFVQGTTTANFGAGITVASLTVNSATAASAVLNIDPTAATGTRNVTLTTGAEVVTLNNGFTVTVGTLVLQTVNPNTGQQGQQNLSVNLTGQFTHFVQGTTTASFGAGITVASLTVNSSTKATAVLNIDLAASTGTRGVTLITGAELVTLNTGFTVTAGVPLPVLQPPAVDKSVTTDLGTATEFLYTGSNPVQTGVAAGTISKTRAAVIRGKVMTRDGPVLPGVMITILNHPEFGQTLSRADGMFDMAVNGGGPLTVNYAKAGLISAQRQLNVPWKDFALAPDVVMIPFDTRSTFIDASSFPGSTLTPIQVARGTPMTDSDGIRQATLMFQAGTTATMVMPDGSMTAITGLTVRATEYTVGANGPQAMPADLPPNSGYTYALEFSVDEAKAAGAIDVRFSSPLPLYIENFLNFPVGTGVPLGSYDRVRGVWVPSDNGRVLKILSVTNGLANLDTNGDGIADSTAALAALSISDDERRQLAALYQPGQTLWRVLIPHFDQPWDANWGVKPPDSAEAPRQDPRLRKDREIG